MIELLLLGHGAMVPLPDRPLSSVLMRSGGSLVLFDCGEGTQIQMRRYHWGFRKLDTIILSHLHADHVAGLPGLMLTLASAERTEPLHLYGPAGTIETIGHLMAIVPGLPFELVLHQVETGDRFAIAGGLQVMVGEAFHRIPCLAYRVELPRAPRFDAERAEALGIPRSAWSNLQRGAEVMLGDRTIVPDEVMGEARPGVSFAFMTDTRPDPALVELARGVDLLVCEATYLDDVDVEKANLWGHMTLRQACEIAREAEVGALWTTHFGAGVTDAAPWQESARAMFPRTWMGSAGLTGRLVFDRGFED